MITLCSQTPLSTTTVHCSSMHMSQNLPNRKKKFLSTLVFMSRLNTPFCIAWFLRILGTCLTQFCLSLRSILMFGYSGVLENPKDMPTNFCFHV